MAHPDLNELRRVVRSGKSSSAPQRPTPSVTRERTSRSYSLDWLWAVIGWVVCMWILLSGLSCINKSLRSHRVPVSTSTTTTTTAARGYATVVTMLPEARQWIPTKVEGRWRGTFDGRPAELHLRNRNGNRFSGTLIFNGNKGQYHITVGGVLAENGRIAMQETSRLRIPRDGQWTLGVNAGRFSQSDQVMSGRGQAGARAPYPWSFRRVR